jgi:hypothetical protein
MAEQGKKPQAPQKPAMNPKPAASKPAAPTSGSGCCGSTPMQKPAGQKPGQK